ncbi:MAG TPA: PEP-CTERM sorting domain-containing protein, partial [Candidatus Acidoferrum sp.]|nr:PEP-CTERM sorting domain-containing protein [Candidatus Acidoferrum sp.]
AFGPRLAYEHGLQTYSWSPLHTSAYGPWLNVDDKYLGLKLMIGGQVHYGWAQLSVDLAHESPPLPVPYLNTFLTGYAYETVAGQAIAAGAAPEPGTLGLLALGSLGLGLWRRRKVIASK